MALISLSEDFVQSRGRVLRTLMEDKGTLPSVQPKLNLLMEANGTTSHMRNHEVRLSEQALGSSTSKKDFCTNLLFCSAKSKCTIRTTEKRNIKGNSGTPLLSLQNLEEHLLTWNLAIINCILCKAITLLKLCLGFCICGAQFL